eukprot:COSAG02_NODE_33254_length_503_cov_0.730198_1_plen_135_part_10
MRTRQVNGAISALDGRAREIKALQASKVVSAVRVELQAVCEARTPERVTGTRPPGDDVREADSANADERHRSTPLHAPECENEAREEETHSEITDELRRAFLQLTSSEVLPSPVMTSVRPDDAEDPGATGATTGD